MRVIYREKDYVLCVNRYKYELGNSWELVSGGKSKFFGTKNNEDFSLDEKTKEKLKLQGKSPKDFFGLCGVPIRIGAFEAVKFFLDQEVGYEQISAKFV